MGQNGTPRKGQATAKAGQAATELAVFGAILIFLIGTIMRTAVGNSFTQDYNFKAMRMAMLASWNDTKINQGPNASAVTAHNSASILFVEDRLSPDASKYGDIDRNPFVAQGAGTFTYNLLYPLSDAQDINAGLPVMDVFINGVHFPFSMSSYVIKNEISRQSSCPSNTSTCAYNQCMRNLTEWVGGNVSEGSFASTQFAPVVPLTKACAALTPATAQKNCQVDNNALVIFSDLITADVLVGTAGSVYNSANTALVNPSLTTPFVDTAQWQGFVSMYNSSFSGQINKSYLNAILKVVQTTGTQYKLFYNIVPNGSTDPQFMQTAPTCSQHPCKNNELSADRSFGSYAGTDLMFDLQRIYNPYPNPSLVPDSMRSSIGWEWQATAGTTANMIGLNKDQQQYPSLDIDGRLRPVTIYDISQAPNGDPIVSYEDPDGGDIDSGWDPSISCGPKPGLLTGSEIFTFTGNGTYLQVNEGKMFNPESGQVVRSVNKRDTVDLVQRMIQLTNNTTRFCTPCADGSACVQNSNGVYACSNGNGCVINGPGTNLCTGANCANPNSVEACVSESSGTPRPCFTTTNMPLTCYDTTSNILYVRSRLQDRRGTFWMTNTSGQLKVQ